MNTLNYEEITITDSLLSKIITHKAYKNNIESHFEAVLVLKNEVPFTYILRKGDGNLCFYVTFTNKNQEVISEKFIIDPDKLQYQYWNATSCSYENPIHSEEEDPYYLKFFSDLDDIIFLAAMKCNKEQAIPLQ